MMNRIAAATALTCVALAMTSVASAQPGVEPLTRQQLLTGAQINRPVHVTHAPDDYGRIFILEQKPVAGQGRIRVFNLHTNQLLPTPFLTITGVTTGGNEQGLLGIAFHPNYAENGHFFVNFTGSGSTIIRRYTVSRNNPNVADPNSAKTIMTFNQPAGNHNGGWIGFGPDGYLYIATGDGGGSGDNQASPCGQPLGNGQCLISRLGKMLRIDVDVPDGGAPFAIPADNPFVGQAGLDEIWSYGLRNPWRASFDRETGDLYIGDVGQNAWEEINFQHADSPGGENYGWKCYEGNAAFSTGNCPGSPDLVWPFHVYGISGFGNPRCAVMGGYVYRGCNIPSLNGTYFFADYCPGHVFSIKYDRDNVPDPSSTPQPHPVSDFTDHTGNLGSGVGNITSFGQDARGEMYFMSLSTTAAGGVYRIVPVTPTVSHADLDCSGSVGVSDLLFLLSQWGECFGCKSDLTGDGIVGVEDLLELLSEWG